MKETEEEERNRLYMELTLMGFPVARDKELLDTWNIENLRKLKIHNMDSGDMFAFFDGLDLDY